MHMDPSLPPRRTEPRGPPRRAAGNASPVMPNVRKNVAGAIPRTPSVGRRLPTARWSPSRTPPLRGSARAPAAVSPVDRPRPHTTPTALPQRTRAVCAPAPVEPQEARSRLCPRPRPSSCAKWARRCGRPLHLRDTDTDIERQRSKLKDG